MDDKENLGKMRQHLATPVISDKTFWLKKFTGAARETGIWATNFRGAFFTGSLQNRNPDRTQNTV